ncbi:hypothetical protein [Niallia nealsonii]|uniref:Uncharacterized protein n=1 Tax=Niallia nealsonii TaxID=115979 RepID=A0A2N0Z4F9_9BACI|nr:hypothetical protein [Niallia nealsonii]PKG24369.1 hypothetical protein CWS01_07070 [Niallia nealsonii]
MENKHFIQVKKNVFELGAEETFIYSIISKNSLIDGATMINLPYFLELLGMSNRTENRSKLKKYLSNLSSSLDVKYYKDFRLQKTVDVEKMKPSQHYYAQIPSAEGGFVKFYIKDFTKLMLIDSKEYKSMLLLQYLFMIGTIKESKAERLIGWQNIEQIAEAIRFNKKTVMKYNKIFQENELIYCGTVHLNGKDKNIYSRWDEQNDVIEAVKEAKVTGHISKKRKQKENEGVIEKKHKPLNNTFQQQANNNDIAPEVMIAIDSFLDAGLILHKKTKEKIEQAIQICGSEQFVKVVKELESRCKNTMSEGQWAGYFSNNIIASAKEQRTHIDAQNKAMEELEKGQPQLESERLYPPHVMEWKIKGFNSREEYKKAKDKEDMEKLIASLQLG